MFCGHCGTALNGEETVCPNCGNAVKSNTSTETVEGHVYNSPEEIKGKVNATGLLVWSIVELICCSPIFGIIALILYFTSLQNEIKAGNLQGALKMKKTIMILLIVGIVISLIGTIFSALGVGLMVLAEL